MITGRTLRSERVKRGWSVADVADKLNLSVGIVEAMERDAWDELPGGHYRRAFLQAYLHLFNPSDTGILAEEERFVPRFSEPESSRMRNRRAVPLLLISFLLIIGLVVAGWWFQYHGTDGAKVLQGGSAVPPAHTSRMYKSDQGSVISIHRPSVWTLEIQRSGFFEIEADGIQIFSGDLKKGDHFEIRVQSKLKIDTENDAGSFDVHPSRTIESANAEPIE